MASRRRHQGADAFESPPLTIQEADGLLFGDIDEIDRQRVITRPVNLSEITIAPEIQVRVGGLDEETVEKYMQVLLNGGEFSDEVDLFRDDKSNVNYLADGAHRHEATRRALQQAEKPDEIAPLRARIHPGGLAAAIEWAEEANLRHGKALSNADKRNIFERRVKRGHGWAQMSDRAIAKELGIDNKTVGNWRRSLTVENSTVTATRKGADGREYDISKIRLANERRLRLSRVKPIIESIDLEAFEESRLDELQACLRSSVAYIQQLVKANSITVHELPVLLDYEWMADNPRMPLIDWLLARIKPKSPAPRYVQDDYSQPGYEEDFVEYDEPTTSTTIPDVNSSNAREVALLHLREAAVAFRLLGMDDHAQGLEDYVKELESGWSSA
jgi:hypothetical protein